MEFFLIYLVKLIGETETFGKSACVVVLFNDNQMLISVILILVVK